MQNNYNHLSTFSVLYLIKGILTLLFSFLPLIYMGMGGFFMGMDHHTNGFNPGIIFLIVGGFFFVVVVVIGILEIMASKYLKEARKHKFIFAIAIVNCFTGILGILLGVFTIVELNKPEVKTLFENGEEKELL